MTNVSGASSEGNICHKRQKVELCGDFIKVCLIQWELDVQTPLGNAVEAFIELIGARLFLRKLSLTGPADHTSEMVHDILDVLQLPLEDICRGVVASGKWQEAMEKYKPVLLYLDDEGVGKKMYDYLIASPEGFRTRALKEAIEGDIFGTK